MPAGIAFLGLSHPHFEGRARAVRELGIHLAALYDPRSDLASRAARDWGAPAREARDILEDPEVRLVIIEAERNTACSELARAAFAAGKTCLLEKPGAPNLATLRELAELSRKWNAPCQLGYHMRYSPAVRRAAVWLEEGWLGEITLVRSHAAVPAPWLETSWFTDPEDMGGLVYLDACHVIDLLVRYFGEPARVSGRTWKRAHSTVPFEDAAVLVLEYPGFLASLDVTGWEANDWIETWVLEIYGTAGTLRLGIHPPRLDLFLREPRGGLAAGWSSWKAASHPGELNYQEEIRSLWESLPEGISPEGCPIDQALTTAGICHRFYAQAGGES